MFQGARLGPDGQPDSGNYWQSSYGLADVDSDTPSIAWSAWLNLHITASTVMRRDQSDSSEHESALDTCTLTAKWTEAGSEKN